MDGLVEERKVFPKEESEVKSQIIFHILSVGHVVRNSVQQKAFSNMLQHKQVFYKCLVKKP